MLDASIRISFINVHFDMHRILSLKKIRKIPTEKVQKPTKGYTRSQRFPVNPSRGAFFYA